MPVQSGRIIAVCINPNEGVRKFPQQSVCVGRFGLVGDFHNRERRPSFRIPGTTKPNTDRHITIVAGEAYDFINAKLGTALQPGDFGENIHVRGMGDLSDIPDGAWLTVVSTEIILQVTEQNVPCRNLRPYHRLMVKTAHGRRGLLCSIVKGEGQCFPPDSILVRIS